MAFGNLIGQSPFLSKIQNFFAQPQAQQGMQLPQAQLPMPGIRQDPPSQPGAVPADQNGMAGGSNGGGDLLSSLLKNDKDGSSIISKIVSLFGG